MTSELRPALEVWDLLWDAFTGTPPQSGNPNAPFEAAAAVIQAYGDEREAKGRAEQAAELARLKSLSSNHFRNATRLARELVAANDKAAKFKALAETLAGALGPLRNAAEAVADSLNTAVMDGAIDKADKALRQYKEARDD